MIAEILEKENPLEFDSSGWYSRACLGIKLSPIVMYDGVFWWVAFTKVSSTKEVGSGDHGRENTFFFDEFSEFVELFECHASERRVHTDVPVADCF